MNNTQKLKPLPRGWKLYNFEESNNMLTRFFKNGSRLKPFNIRAGDTVALLLWNEGDGAGLSVHLTVSATWRKANSFVGKGTITWMANRVEGLLKGDRIAFGTENVF